MAIMVWKRASVSMSHTLMRSVRFSNLALEPYKVKATTPHSTHKWYIKAYQQSIYIYWLLIVALVDRKRNIRKCLSRVLLLWCAFTMQWKQKRSHNIQITQIKNSHVMRRLSTLHTQSQIHSDCDLLKQSGCDVEWREMRFFLFVILIAHYLVLGIFVWWPSTQNNAQIIAAIAEWLVDFPFVHIYLFALSATPSVHSELAKFSIGIISIKQYTK